MKVNKTPVIVMAILTAIFAIAAVVCLLLPTPDNGSPVKVTDKVKLSYNYYYGGHELEGKIQNVSDKEVVLYSEHSIVLYFNDDDHTSDTVIFEEDTLVLLPGEEFNLEDSLNLYNLTGSISVTRVRIEVDGVSYEVSGTRPYTVLFFMLIILAIIFLAVTISVGIGVKNSAARARSIDALVTQMGGGTVVKGLISDKDQNKKNAAKSAGSVAVGAISAVFLGVGVYKIYPGASQSDFIINDHLYVLNGNGKDVNPGNLQMITKNEFPVESVTVKKNNVIVKCIDNKRTIKLFTNKNSGITAQQLADKVNDILVNAPDPVPVQNDAAASDPFASDSDVTAKPED